MRSLEHLRILIRTLDQVEIDWIRARSVMTKQASSGNLLDLFETLLEEENSSVGDPSVSEKRMRTLPEVRDRLWFHLMEALRHFHASDDLRAQLRNRIEEYHILQSKCLYDLAENVLAGAKEMARKYERFYEFLEILNMEKTRLGRMVDLGEEKIQREKLEAEEEHCLQQLYNYTRYRNMSKKITEIYRSGDNSSHETRLEKLGRIFNHPLLKAESSALSNTALYYQYHQKITYFYYLGHLEQAYKVSNKLLQLLRTYPFLVDISIDGFIATSFNNLVCALDLGLYAEYDKRLKEFLKIPEVLSKGHTRKYRKMIFERSEYLKLKKDLQLGRYEQGILSVPKFLSDMQQWPEGIDSYFEGYIYYLFAYFYFLSGRFEQALEWVDKIQFKKDFRDDQISAALMLGHLAAYELQDMDRLCHGISKTRLYLKKHNRLSEVENAVLNTLEVIAKNEGETDVTNEFRKLRDSLAKFNARVFTQDHLSHFDFRAWAESKLMGIPYNDVFLKREEAGKFRALR